MIRHEALGTNDFARRKVLIRLYKGGKIQVAGNLRLKIYGKLTTCRSGKRMNVSNRVFFQSEQEAIEAGFRPCAHCMNRQYKIWKKRQPAH